MAWFKTRWSWLLLNGFALFALISILFALVNRTEIYRNVWDREALAMLEAGKWSIRFLLLCLSMTPLYLLFGWRDAPGLRKTAGLWAFAFGALHFGLYLKETAAKLQLPTILQQPHLLTGALTLGILSLLALTSHRWAMRWLGKWWKRLHRWVYLAGILAIVHGLLATQASKKVMIFDPNAAQELQVYLGILAVLLIVRVRQVRRLFGVSKRKRSKRKREFAQADR